MTNNILPDSAHVVRYAKPSSIFEDGSIDIYLRPNEDGLSFNWLECFGNIPKEEQLAQVRQASRITLSRNGCLIEWHVGQTREYLLSHSFPVQFISKPCPATQEHKEDPSHGEIEGVPPRDSPQADSFGDLIARCIMARHPAVSP